MTVFDWVVIAVVVLSVLFAYARGVIRELIALVAWLSAPPRTTRVDAS